MATRPGFAEQGAPAPRSVGRLYGRLSQDRRLRTTAEQVADAVGVMIVEGRLAAGARIGEEKLASLYRVSRGPVRDAFRILEKRRLVDIIPRRGAFVRPVTRESIADLFNVRIALAGLAAATVSRRVAAGAEGRVMRKIDRRLEQLRAMAAPEACNPLEYSFQLTCITYTIIAASGNKLLGDIWSELNEHTFWVAIWRTPQDTFTRAERQERLAQVESTIQAIHRGDPAGAEAGCRLWMELIRDRVLANLDACHPSGLAP